MQPPERACPECKGFGYLVAHEKSHTATARRCSCQAECTRCGESGYVLTSSGESYVAQECSCRQLDQRVHEFNAIGIPAAHARSSFDTYREWTPDHVAAKKAAEGLARKFRADVPTKGILFYGRPGGGKTHALCAVLRYLALERGIASRYVEFMLLLSDIRAGFEAKRSHMEILRPLLRVPVLAIDELGKERGTEWERSMLDELISRRYNTGLTTLFATNHFDSREEIPKPVNDGPGRIVKTRSPEFRAEAEAMTLSERIGDRVVSRIREMCVAVKLDPGIDFRRDKGVGGYWGGNTQP